MFQNGGAWERAYTNPNPELHKLVSKLDMNLVLIQYNLGLGIKAHKSSELRSYVALNWKHNYTSSCVQRIQGQAGMGVIQHHNVVVGNTRK